MDGGALLRIVDLRAGAVSVEVADLLGLQSGVERPKDKHRSAFAQDEAAPVERKAPAGVGRDDARGLLLSDTVLCLF